VRWAFVRRHPVRTYYALTFTISWGGFLLVGGPGLFAGTNWQTDPRFLPAVLVMLTGPAIAGLVLTDLVDGRVGLRELLARLLRWRVGARWYAAAVLLPPLVAGVVPLALSLGSHAFLPAIVTADDKPAVLLAGIAVGFTTLLEEVGWTGFVTPRLKLRHGTVATGLVMGVLWGVWHLLSTVWVVRTAAAMVPPSLFLALYFLSAVASLTAYRVLIVWAHDRTESLLIAWLTHASYAACTIFIFAPPVIGAPFLIYAWTFAAVLWVVVAAAAVTPDWQLSRQPPQTRVA
jgi:membrane protease YdiL (CAAX protease family)